MIIEYPDYYEKFKCVGGDCKDTCCAGWEIDIDEETFYYYMFNVYIQAYSSLLVHL